MSTPLFSFERTGSASGVILCSGMRAAEIVDLVLVHAAGRPGGASLIMSSPGTPLYWRQYERHDDVERAASSHLLLEDPVQTGDLLQLRGSSATLSRSVESSVDLRVTLDPATGTLGFSVALALRIDAEEGWRVTPHPHHGELAFCSVWPRDVFAVELDRAKRFTHCVVDNREAGLSRIVHHHLESADKHRIVLRAGDRLLWAAEDENPVITLHEGRDVEAGLCAYMWDVHAALRVCSDRRDVVLAAGGVWRAVWELGVLRRAEASAMLARARDVDGGAVLDTPLIERGVNSFARTFRDAGDDAARVWPWTHVITAGEADHVAASRSDSVGCSDSCSVRITHAAPAASRWEATALGPAFGEPAFSDSAPRLLRAMLRTSNLQGAARIAVRVHREGLAGLFDIGQWERFESEALQTCDSEWTELLCAIPPLTPRPDRVHVLLEVEGRGTVWFDDVLLVEVP